MPRIRLRDVLAGNSPTELVVAAAVATAILAVIWAVRAVVRRKLRNAHLTPTDIDDFVLDAANRTKLLLLVLPAIHFGVRLLTLPDRAELILTRAAEVSFIAQAALWVAGLIDFWLRRYSRTRADSDPGAVTTIQVFRTAMLAAIWLIAVIVAIDNLGFNVTTLIAGLGIGGIAVALATQNILADLFASLSIVIDKPFVVGDSIGVDTLNGTVEQIGLKTTRIRSVEGEELIVSNGDLLKSRIRNYRRMTSRRALLRFGVSQQTAPELLERIPQLVRQAIESQRHVRFDRAHLVTIGENIVRFEAAYYVTSPEYALFLDAQQAVNLAVLRALKGERIDFVQGTTTADVKPA